MSTDLAPPFPVQNRTTRVRRSKDGDRVVTADRESNATEQRAASPAPRVDGVSTPVEEPQRRFQAADDGLVHPDRSVDLDLLLESLHRERLTPIDLRVLLRVTDDEPNLADLADSMGQPATVIRRVSTELLARGLVRRRRRRSRGGRLALTLGITGSGMSALRRMTRSLQIASTDRANSPRSRDRPTQAASEASDDPTWPPTRRAAVS